MSVSFPVYLDYAATTPVDGRVLAAMQPYFQEFFGNPSSIHIFGQKAEAAVENAREGCSRLLNCHPSEVVFTSCGTESNNLAIRGGALAMHQQTGANHLLYGQVEHHAVVHTMEQLAHLHGFEVEAIPVDRYGQVSPQAVAERLRPATALVSVMLANNEIGTLNPVQEIGALCRARGILFQTDAVQAAAYLPLDVEALQVDFLSLGAHKFYGPKGVGALYIRRGTPVLPVITGGGQEYGLRSGTHNVPYIVGLAEALWLANAERGERTAHVAGLRDELVQTVLDAIPDSLLTGHPTQRLPNHASFAFQRVDGNMLLTLLDLEGFACSSGSACRTGNPEPSVVLKAIGLPRSWALGSLRVTLGAGTTREEIEAFAAALPGLVARLRG